LIVYNHYDVQPIDPINEWKVNPFSATIINDRLYARGSSENKETLISRLYAIKKLLDLWRKEKLENLLKRIILLILVMSQ